jgi:hypothetical protein
MRKLNKMSVTHDAEKILSNIEYARREMEGAESFVRIYCGMIDGPAPRPETLFGVRMLQTSDPRVVFPVLKSKMFDLAREGLAKHCEITIDLISKAVDDGILGKVVGMDLKAPFIETLHWLDSELKPKWKT